MIALAVGQLAVVCPYGWSPAPEDGGSYSASCYKSVGWATSLDLVKSSLLREGCDERSEL